MAGSKDIYEQLIDKYGLQNVLADLSVTCYEKSEHILTNWQDRALARKWVRAGQAIDRCSSAAAIEDVS